jgi:hypothetical protein
VASDQAWKDDGRAAASRGRRGPQYVHVEVFRSFRGGRLDVGGARLRRGMSSEESEELVRGVVGSEDGTFDERYGMNA